MESHGIKWCHGRNPSKKHIDYIKSQFQPHKNGTQKNGK